MTWDPVTPVLEVDGLRVEIPTRRGTVRAVRGVSFTVQPGETFALVGESGSGKSMTCRAILRLIHPPGRIAGGSIRFEGQELLELSETAMQRVRGAGISMVFQDPMTALNPVLSIERQITETIDGSRPAREARQEAARLLRQVGIPDPERRLREYPHQLSGGQRQRVMLAIALAQRPRLLLADEPTTALDVTIQAQILRLLASLQDELGMAVVLVTHDLAVVSEVADRVAVMYAGQIMELAPTAELLSRPRHPYTIGLIRSMPGLDQRTPLEPIPGTPPNLVQIPPGCPFAPRCAWASRECTAAEIPVLPVGDGHWSRCLKAAELSTATGGRAIG